MLSATNSDLGTAHKLLKHPLRCIPGQDFAAFLANNHLFSLNYKTLFDIATCTFLKRQTKFEAKPFALVPKCSLVPF